MVCRDDVHIVSTVKKNKNMNLIIPMAGMGKRMRPHTLSIPKPLIPVAGKPIVQRLVEDISRVCKQQIDEIAFIIHPSFGAEVEKMLLDIAKSLGATGKICYQEEPKGTAHAILCAGDSLCGNVVVAFADTLFIADFNLDTSKDSIIWVQKVDDPSAFGVVKLNNDGMITDFVEKPKDFVSGLAIIGIYYFKDGKNLRAELQYLIDNNVIKGTEYQLTDALENMKNKGLKFYTGQVNEWLDCGNKNATVQTNQRVLVNCGSSISKDAEIVNSQIIEPCCIAAGTKIENSVVGPYVSVGEGTKITHSVVSNSIIQTNSNLANVNITNSMVGNSVKMLRSAEELSVGDYNEL